MQVDEIQYQIYGDIEALLGVQIDSFTYTQCAQIH